MSKKEEPLALYGHRIIPAATHQGSVRKWRCLNCGAEVKDVEEYLDQSCSHSDSRRG